MYHKNFDLGLIGSVLLGRTNCMIKINYSYFLIILENSFGEKSANCLVKFVSTMNNKNPRNHLSSTYRRCFTTAVSLQLNCTLLEEFDSVGVNVPLPHLLNSPDFVGPQYHDCDHASEHYHQLNSICPDDSFKSTLKNSFFQNNFFKLFVFQHVFLLIQKAISHS